MVLFDIFKKRKERERFERKQKEKTEVETVEEKGEKKQGALAKASNFARKVIIKPHVVEKSTQLNEKGMYVFKVAEKANKIMIKRAVKETYGVVPRKINIVNIPPKKIFIRRRQGTKPGFKKAIVFLKKGEKIEIS